jgi:protein-disulfide isomerase
MNKLLVTTALALTLASPLSAQSAMTEAERAAFRSEVRAYLLENPEVLMEAIAVLEDKRNSEAEQYDVALLQTNADDIFSDPASWVGGNPDGDVTIVEFMDYRCSFCKKAHDEVSELIASDGNIRFIVKEFPILGEQSDLASRFAIAVLQVEGADHYKAVHDFLMTHLGDVTPNLLTQIATDLNFTDTEAVIARMTSDDVTAVIDANHLLASRMQINGTPTFIVDGTMLRGYVPLESMQQIVAQERAG